MLMAEVFLDDDSNRSGPPGLHIPQGLKQTLFQTSIEGP